MNIVFFQTAFLGDVLLSIPALKAIRRKFPNAKLTYVCKPGLKELILSLNLVDGCEELDKRNSAKQRQIISVLNALDVDTLYCAHESFRTHLLVARIRARRKVGFRSWWNGLFFDVRILRPMNFPEPIRGLALVEELDSEKLMSSFPGADQDVELNDKLGWKYFIPESLALTCDVMPTAIDAFGLKKPYVVIAPSSQWATKMWTAAGFATVVHAALEKSISVYLVGSPAEKDACQEVLNQLKTKYREVNGKCEVRSIAGQTDLVQLLSVLKGAVAAVANDSGPMHMACVVDTPVVGVFGPTTLSLGYRPWANNSIVIQQSLSCRPCGSHGHKTCPIGTHECMKAIDPMRVSEQLSLKIDRAIKKSHLV
jgi:heptosyltransferase-2